MTGRIYKGIAGFYYVKSISGIYACKAKGIFRKDAKKPLVGDYVDFEITDEKDMEGNVTAIHERKNSLIRPEVSNIDQALVIFSFTRPDLNEGLLNRYLVKMERQDMPVIICFNKEDLADDSAADDLRKIYEESAGYKVLFTAAKAGEGIDDIKALLKGRTTVLAGPSGVGKSTTINRIVGESRMETGSLSEKIGRGKNTTRHAELIELEADTWIIDTPGFSSIEIIDILPEELGGCFPEIRKHTGECRFAECAHISEPDCGVKEAVESGEITRERYDEYVRMYAACKEKRRY